MTIITTPPVSSAINEDGISKLRYFGYRHVMGLMLLFASTAAFVMRASIPIAILAMVNQNQTVDTVPTFDWDNYTQNILLSSFLWGYFVCMIPCGMLTRTFGSKTVLFFTLSLSSVASLLTPLLTTWYGYIGFGTLSFLVGLAHGPMYPCFHDVMTNWIPPNERGFTISLIFSGGQLGPVIALPLSGYLAQNFGWPYIFYVVGVVGIVWCLLWIKFGSSRPYENSFISNDEKLFIERSLNDALLQKTGPTPWKAIFTSGPIWAINIAHIAYVWGLFTTLTEMPIYFQHILHFDIESNGNISALPHVAKFFLSFLFGIIADILRKHKLMSLLNMRKLFNTIGLLIPGLALLAVGYIPAGSTIVSVVLMIIAVSINAACYQGFFVNDIDLAPSFASTLMGASSMIACFIGIFPPVVTGLVVKNPDSAEEWRTVFWISGGMYIISSVFYLIFAKTDIQPWNDTSTPVKKSAD